MKRPGEPSASFDDPRMDILKHEAAIASIFMFGVPLATFFFVQSKSPTHSFVNTTFLSDYFYEQLTPDEDLYAGLAAVVATQVTMVCILIVKYSDDFKASFSGEGRIPYEGVVGREKIIEDLMKEEEEKAKSKSAEGKGDIVADSD